MTAPATNSVNLRSLLEEMIERDASDLHITAGDRPKLRIDGDITDANVDVVLNPKDTLQLAYSILTENQKKRFEMEDELDFSFGIQNLARFRGNCFKQRGCDACGGSGLKGRQGLYEVMAMTPKLRKLILQNVGAAEIRDAAVADGMLTLRMDGLLKVMKGITTLEQVIRETAA